MTELDTKATLWANALSLMETHYGAEMLGRFARETGIGAASMTRIKKMQTSVGVDVIEKIAQRFNLRPWQVLAPKLGAELYVLTPDRRMVSVTSVDAEYPGVTSPGERPHDVPLLNEPGSTQWQRKLQGKERETRSTTQGQSTRRKKA